MSGRNVGYSETAEGFTHTVGYKYNSDNNLIELTEDINGAERTTTYKYDDDNRTTEITTNGTTVAYTYDGFGRVTQQVTKLKGENEETPDTVILTEYFTYTAPTTATTSGQVATYRTVGGNYDITYSYTYDDNGNITSVYNGSIWIHYAYDSANQLIREDNQDRGRTYTWTYDNAGNILSFNTYAYTRGALGTALDTVAYGYGDEDWGDLMTSYDGTAVTYDEIGNPETLNGRTYVWEHGRQLKSMTSGDVTWTYTYNNAGLRTGRVGTKTDDDGKTTTTATYEYIYNGSQLVRMVKDGEVIDFTYDAAGTPLTMTYDEVTYYYVTNLQGDVVGLLDENGNKMISYRYTAYGQGFIFSDESDMTLILANINPLGYRGYVMDVGTATYYCQSRYYDPVFGRFINADGFVSTGQGFTGNNMFAYCGNNPVNRADPTGMAFESIERTLIIIAENARRCVRSVRHTLGFGYEEIYRGSNYSYTFGSSGDYMPGDISGQKPNDWSVDEVETSFIADFEAMGYEIRPLSGPNDPTSENEYIIAFRVDDVLYTSNDQPDNPAYNAYFMVRTGADEWTAKPHAGSPDSFTSAILNSDSAWRSLYVYGPYDGFWLSYRSDTTKYYAVSYY